MLLFTIIKDDWKKDVADIPDTNLIMPLFGAFQVAVAESLLKDLDSTLRTASSMSSLWGIKPLSSPCNDFNLANNQSL